MAVDKAGRFVEVDTVAMLRPDEQILRDMLTGWRNQQLSRNLQLRTIEARERLIERFVDATNEYPWAWTVSHIDEFFGDLRSLRHVKATTVRGYQTSLRLFCEYVTSTDYGWPAACERYFGATTSQVCFEWNTVAHVQDTQSAPTKRAFTQAELQRLFDRADDEVEQIHAHQRKGWLAAYRDAVLLKTAYAWGLRRNEVRHLQSVDFSRNPHAREFGRYGVVQVRYGKARKGSPPKRRSVLTVFDWSVDIIKDWIDVHDQLPDHGLDLFVSERGTLVSESALTTRFRRYCNDLALSPGLDFHSLRRSYVTHLIESGMDAQFVQDQVGHEHASTTALYTCVSSDYRVTTLRRALDSTIKDALAGIDLEEA
ncbi:tyrosine-type recombinase/integrase [Yimella sp. cx-51]|nr:tyrosine-type recombinase/integrase [Yimella sp. cx-51]QTH39573.1 tyrosine-type recombinase/integrase [Yimella sp. cx-51]